MKFGDMELLREVASDSRTHVFVATWPQGVEKLCAVNLLNDGVLSAEGLHALKREASWLVRRMHGNLVQVYDVGEVDGRYFYASELVEGRGVDALVSRAKENGEPLSIDIAIHICMEVALALDFIRAGEEKATGIATSIAGLGSPSVLVGADGQVKLMHYGSCLAPSRDDWGSLSAGRLSWIAPERIRGVAAVGTARTDVYALGALLWEVLTGSSLSAQDAGPGQTPDGDASEVTSFLTLVADSDWAPSSSALDAAIAPAGESAAEELSAIVMDALDPDPDKRPASVVAMRERLSFFRKTHDLNAGQADVRAAVSKFFAKELAEEAADLTALSARHYVTGERRGTHNTLTNFELPRRRTASDLVRDLPVGEIIPGTRYRVLSKIGEGGMGVVYEAQHIDIERRVALKLLHAELLENPSVVQQFRQEARAASRIGNPYICDVTDWGEVEDGRVFFVMEYLDGPSLGLQIKSSRKMAPQRVLPILRQVAKALGAAHQKGIVHLDVKPDNVLLIEGAGRSDRVKVVDFGIASLLGQGGGSGKVMGTPEYMAPERASGRSDAVTDIYALGVMGYEMLTGEVPFQGTTPVETLALHAMDPPTAFKEQSTTPIPACVEAVIFRMLEKDPYKRPQTMSEVEVQLIEAQIQAGIRTPWDDLPFPEIPEALERRFSRKLGQPADTRRSRAITWTFAAVALAAVGVAAFAVAKLRSQQQVTGADAAVASPTTNGLADGQSDKRGPEERPVNGASPVHDRAQQGPARASGVKPSSGTPNIVRNKKRAEEERRAKRENRQAAKAAATRGKKALRDGRLLQARNEFESALKVDPTFAPAVAGLAEVAFEEAQYPVAATLALQASRLAPTQSQYLVILGDAYYKLGKLDDALVAYEKAGALRPESGTITSRIERVRARVK